MAIADAHGLPIGISIASATPHEAKLVETTIESVYTPYLPKRLIGDKVYDSDKLDEVIRQRYGIEIIAPHKRNRRKSKTQDGRSLRRYRNRWKIERTFSWLQNFRRLVTSYEVRDENFLGMLQLGCIIILLRRF